MKNILDEKPTTKLHGRLLYSKMFVIDEDIKGKNVLDIGCGFGWMELNLLSRGVKNVAGVELSEKDLKTAKENIKNKRCSFFVGSAFSLPFTNEIFDTVIAWEVIEHIPKGSENRMFKEVYRVLKPNGIFYLSTPYNSFLSKILDPAWWFIGHRHYSKLQLIKYGQDNNFKILDIETKGRLYSIAFLLNLYIAKWIFRQGPFLKNYFQNKENLEYLQNGYVNIFVKYGAAKSQT